MKITRYLKNNLVFFEKISIRYLPVYGIHCNNRIIVFIYSQYNILLDMQDYKGLSMSDLIISI